MPRRTPDKSRGKRGRALLKVREALGETQATLSRLMEVHPSTLSAWESGLRPMPGHRLDQLRVLVTTRRWRLSQGTSMTNLLRAIEEVR